jgi:hypothetical protein
MTWFKKIIPSIGLLLGMVLVAIGSIMLLSSAFKLVFNVSTSYNDYYVCESRYNPSLEHEVTLDPVEIENCKEKELAREQENFIQEKTSNIIDGGAFLVVGAFFWIFFWKRNREG